MSSDTLRDQPSPTFKAITSSGFVHPPERNVQPRINETDLLLRVYGCNGGTNGR